MRGSGFSHRIRWTDARLFDLVGAGGFELAGTHQIARWSRLESADMVRSAIPFSEYTWQMNLLVSLIYERTGLPLYDLHEKQ